jgi:hypothetical protein
LCLKINPCAGKTCSGHGVCALKTDDSTACFCESGYHNGSDPMTCELDANPCDSVDCDGNGTCMNAEGNAVCICNDGFYATTEEPTHCTAATVPNPCDGVTCSDHGACWIDYPDTPKGVCTEGYSNGTPTTCVAD